MLASCNTDKEVDIVYQFTSKIDILDVVKELKDIQNADAFPNGKIDIDGYHVRVNFFMYDKDGAVVEKDTKIVNDFAQVVNVTKAMPEGEYTVVATADIVKNAGDRIDFEYWKFENPNTLRDFKIKDLNYVGFEYKALGIYKEMVNINKSTNLNISVKPAGSLITMWFRNAYVSSIAYIYYEWNKSSDYYLINEDKANVLNTGSSDDFEVESAYTGYYDQRYFLPVQDFKFTWATYNSSINVVKTNNTTFNITKGVNPTITVDVTTGNTVVSNNTKSGVFESIQDKEILMKSQVKSSTSQNLEVGSFPVIK